MYNTAWEVHKPRSLHIASYPKPKRSAAGGRPGSSARTVGSRSFLSIHRSGVIEIKLIRDKETVFNGLYERSVLLITEKVLDLLSKEQPQAVVAHELAHERFWDEYHLARAAGQDDKVQEFELRCDGLAIFVLARLGLEPARLISALHKTAPYDRDTWRTNYYAAPDERVAFARAMIQLVKNADQAMAVSARAVADSIPK